MSIVLNCKQPEYMYFDRKNYYYPDLPKGYQITQMHNPVGVHGSIIIDCNGYEKEIKIADIHLEEDAASMEHYSDVSLIDYNRAGVPLLEVVTEPCISSADEAIALVTPKTFSLEEALEFIESDEYVEVTPDAIRMRKAILY